MNVGVEMNEWNQHEWHLYLNEAIMFSEGGLFTFKSILTLLFGEIPDRFAMFQIPENYNPFNVFTFPPQGSYWAIDANPPDDPLPPRHKKRRPSEKSSPYSPGSVSPSGSLNQCLGLGATAILTPFGSPEHPGVTQVLNGSSIICR